MAVLSLAQYLCGHGILAKPVLPTLTAPATCVLLYRQKPKKSPPWPAIVVGQAGKVLQQFGADDVWNFRSQGTYNTKVSLIIFRQNPQVTCDPRSRAGRRDQHLGRCYEQNHMVREAGAHETERPLSNETVLISNEIAWETFIMGQQQERKIDFNEA